MKIAGPCSYCSTAPRFEFYLNSALLCHAIIFVVHGGSPHGHNDEELQLNTNITGEHGAFQLTWVLIHDNVVAQAESQYKIRPTTVHLRYGQ